MQLSVIIVNYNVSCFLEQCLLSVQKAKKGLNIEIFVVDNHSTETGIARIQAKFPWVYYLLNSENEGFAKANNKPLAACKGEQVLFLNPDTLIPENLFQLCLAYLAANEKVGALGVRMIDGKGRYLAESKRAFPSPGAAFFKMIGLANVFPSSRFFNAYALGNLNEFETARVPVLAGACMMIKQPVLKTLNGFDERFFMYGEDIDLSYRIEQMGLENHYFAQTTVLHFKGESSRKNSFTHIKNFYGAMLIFVNKHYHKSKIGVFPFLLRSAIAFRAMGALVMKLIIISVFSPNAKTLKGKTIIVGSVSEYNDVIAILNQNKASKRIPKRIAAEKLSGSLWEKWNELYRLLKNQRCKQIIFCEGNISLVEIFFLVEKLKNTSAKFLYKVSGSDSIVGSGICFYKK